MREKSELEIQKEQTGRLSVLEKKRLQQIADDIQEIEDEIKALRK